MSFILSQVLDMSEKLVRYSKEEKYNMLIPILRPALSVTQIVLQPCPRHSLRWAGMREDMTKVL